MIRRPRSIALVGTCLAGLMLAGCNLSIDNHDDSGGSSGSTTQGSGAGSGTAQYSVGGTVTGLSQSGLVLANGSNTVSVAAGATSFTLPGLLATGAKYSVAVKTQPLGQTCVARNESGTIAQASVTSVQVSCTINTYSIGGTITGVNASGLVLANGTDTVTVPLGATAFVMPTKQPMGATYTITVQTAPTGLTCQVSNGSATMPAAAVTNIFVSCGQWTWMSGANATGSAGSYGSLGSANSTNAPPARSGAVSWRDLGGHLWLFGGASSSGSLNDLWQYDPTSFQWTWMGGANTTNAKGQYGAARGMEAPGNVPGARQGAAGCVDGSGNVWLFGGQGYDGSGTSGLLNDLWEYVSADGEWIWVAGENSAFAMGDMDPTGEPGPRSGAVAWCEGGNFWLFGGNSTTADGSGNALPTNDLWEYTGGSWTLVSGSETAAATGVYGAMGKAAATNVPGSRTLASSFVDGAGTLWLFGGHGYAAIGGSGSLNDLWSFSLTTKQWTWVAGWNTVNAAGDYGTTRTTTGTLLPGAREGASTSVDASGNFWLFGGTGYDGSGKGKTGLLGDLWEYDLAAAQWIWMGGSQTSANVGTYGMQGTGAPGNAPGARSAAVGWMDTTGNFWLFGGQGLAMTQTAGSLNDLWQFTP